MSTKNSRAMTLFEAVMWGTSKQVQEILKNRDLPIDDKWTDYALLLTALRRKRKEIAKILLNKGCRVEKVEKTDDSDKPLHYAVRMNDVEMIRLLLNKGASITGVDKNGETPLCLAMKKASNQIVDLLLSIDSVDKTVNAYNNDKFSHFHIACMRNCWSIVEQYIDSGVNINDPVNFTSSQWPGYTPLHFAVDNESYDVIKVLLRHGADVSIKNAENCTPLHLAVQKQNETIVNLILSSPNIALSNPSNDFGLSHFHIACMRNHLNAAEKLLLFGVNVNHSVNANQPNWPGYTPLHFAVKALSVGCINQISLIELLLRAKADVNAQDIQGQTPLHLACLQSDTRLAKLLQTISNSMETDQSNFSCKSYQTLDQNEQTKVIELLLKHKSNVNVKNMFNETAIFYLYKNDRSKIATKGKLEDDLLKEVIKKLNVKRKEIIQILLNNNADVNVRNDQGQTILHLIASINKEYDDDFKEETVELILSKDADVNAKAKYDSTPLHLAAKHGHWKLAELFLKYNANVNSTEASDQSTPLHLATSYQQVKALNVLLNNKADVTMTKCNGLNVLHLMALMNPETSEDAEFIESYDKIITNFIDLGCDINARDINGRTPLHLASWEHNNAATWAFLQHFADINIEDCGGETALSFPMNNTERCVNIYCMFRDYVSMLRITGLYISEKTDTCFKHLYERNPPDPQDDFLAQCREEIETMKGIRVSASSTVYDILFKSSNAMEIYAGNESLERLVRNENFVKTLKIYGNLLKSQFRKGLGRKLLVNNAKLALEFMIRIGLPDSCSGRIFQYLDDTSLINLTKAKHCKTVTNKNINKKQITYDQSQCASLEKALAYCKSLFDKQMEMEIA